MWNAQWQNSKIKLRWVTNAADQKKAQKKLHWTWLSPEPNPGTIEPLGKIHTKMSRGWQAVEVHLRNLRRAAAAGFSPA